MLLTLISGRYPADFAQFNILFHVFADNSQIYLPLTLLKVLRNVKTLTVLNFWNFKQAIEAQCFKRVLVQVRNMEERAVSLRLLLPSLQVHLGLPGHGR